MQFRRMIIAVVLACAALAPVAADSQVDIGVNVPVAIGLSYQGERVSEQVPVHIPIPDLMYNYYFDTGFLKVGVGARIWTIIILTGGYPIISAEIETERLLLNAHIGGGVFGYLTPFENGSGIETGKVFLPEVSAAFRFTPWFSMGGSLLGIYIPEITTDGMGYTFNIFGRFRVR